MGRIMNLQRAFFTEDILTCHSRKITAVNDKMIKWMMAEFYLAAVNVISNTCAFPTKTVNCLN